jgi:hypothetical protein
MDERIDARRSIEHSTRNVTEIATELSRRASPRYVREQAKEAALRKTSEWKDTFAQSPLALGIVGGALGAAIGSSIGKSRRTQLHEYRPWSTEVEYGSRTRGLYYDEPARSPGMGERISEGAQDLKQKASDLVDDVRDRIPSATTVRHTAEDNPLLIALGGMALGALAALLLPVSNKERELLEPVKQRASEAMGELGEKVRETADQAQETIAGAKKELSESQAKVPPSGLQPIRSH